MTLKFWAETVNLDSWARLSERLLCLVVGEEEEVERLTWPNPVPKQLSSTGCNRGYKC